MKNTKHRIRIHQEGIRSIVGLTFLIFVLNVIIYIISDAHWLLALSLVMTSALLVFVTYFFRNPMREVEVSDENFLIAPADGHVVVIEPTMENEVLHKQMLQVSIFMSPFNVHANWYPIEGTIVRSEHQKGRHMGAWLPKSSIENERSLVVIETKSKMQILVRQIAGAMARRIVTYAKAGHSCSRNEHMGFIKLGSRVDMYLPLDTEIFVECGEAVRGNETIIGRLPEA